MATPDFILRLREKIGHEALWLPGVTGVVFDDAGRVLLGQRADNRQWGLITGILEPGEDPAPGLHSLAAAQAAGPSPGRQRRGRVSSSS
ncbi:8-oxo-dGTP pyrophosphatase MutT (NUDIX family) [Arthrobacter sp. ES3-54]|nr:8-oxo-dGTP pyrophosphatase MutT (NUDIX family) [Arthrobacter sp. ES3-54]